MSICVKCRFTSNYHSPVWHTCCRSVLSRALQARVKAVDIHFSSSTCECIRFAKRWFFREIEIKITVHVNQSCRTTKSDRPQELEQMQAGRYCEKTRNRRVDFCSFVPAATLPAHASWALKHTPCRESQTSICFASFCAEKWLSNTQMKSVEPKFHDYWGTMWLMYIVNAYAPGCMCPTMAIE